MLSWAVFACVVTCVAGAGSHRKGGASPMYLRGSTVSPRILAEGATAAVAVLPSLSTPVTLIVQFSEQAIGTAASALANTCAVNAGFLPPHAWIVHAHDEIALRQLAHLSGLARIIEYAPLHKSDLLSPRWRAERPAAAPITSIHVSTVRGTPARVASELTSALAARSLDKAACIGGTFCVASVVLAAPGSSALAVTRLFLDSPTVIRRCLSTLHIVVAGERGLHISIEAASGDTSNYRNGNATISVEGARGAGNVSTNYCGGSATIPDAIIRLLTENAAVLAVDEAMPAMPHNAFARGTTQATDAPSWSMTTMANEFGACAMQSVCNPSNWMTESWGTPPSNTCTAGCNSPACGFDFQDCYAGTATSPITSAGLTGAGQLVQVIDTGLDYSHAFFVDAAAPTIPWRPTSTNVALSPARKVAAYVAYMDAIDESCGHGTHVSGSVAGYPLAGSTDYSITLPFSGMATGARLIFTDVVCDTPDGCACSQAVPCTCTNQVCQMGTSFRTPADIGDTFAFGYNAGARISSNSWGGGIGVYGQEASVIDDYILEHDDMLILFAASNDGAVTRSGNPVTAYASLSSQAPSKNIIAVGAATRDFPALAAIQSVIL